MMKIIVAALAMAATFAGCGELPKRSEPLVKLYAGLNVLDRRLPSNVVLPENCRWVEEDKYPYGAIHCTPFTRQSVSGYWSAPMYPYAPMSGQMFLWLNSGHR